MESHSAAESLTVVVAYGKRDLTQACVDRFGDPQALVVVDNGLDDELRAAMTALEVRYIRPEANVGFAAAVNLAMSTCRSPGQSVLLLNPDALVTSAQAAQLADALTEHGGVAAVAPLLRSADGGRQRTAWPMPTPGRVWLGVFGLGDRRLTDVFLSGAVLMLSGAALDTLGGLDERYFLYSEETDWQRRALAAGWTLRIVDSPDVEHLGGATSADVQLRELLFHASGEEYFRKWHGSLGWAVARTGSLAAALRRAAQGDRRQLQVAALYLRGPQRVAQRARSARWGVQG